MEASIVAETMPNYLEWTKKELENGFNKPITLVKIIGILADG